MLSNRTKAGLKLSKFCEGVTLKQFNNLPKHGKRLVSLSGMGFLLSVVKQAAVCKRSV